MPVEYMMNASHVVELQNQRISRCALVTPGEFGTASVAAELPADTQ